MIAVTGLGAVCSLGEGVGALLAGLRAGRDGLRPLTRFDPGDLPTGPVGEAPIPDGPGTPTHRLAVAAAREAVAGLDGVPADRVAVVAATTTGGVAGSEAWWLGRRPGDVPDAETLRWHSASTVGRAVAEAVGARGPRLTLSTACSSAANALLVAYDLLATGAADAVVAGGADALCRVTYAGFSSLRLVSQRPCRPFDADRDGLNLGEAGAFLVLERAEDARRRGARVEGFLLGAAVTCDAYHMTSPAPDGDAVVAAVDEALRRGGVRAADVAYVNAHGTGTPANDAAEGRALRRMFGERPPPVSASKSFLGHTLGAAGAIEAVVTLLAVREGFLPATLHTTAPADDAPPDLVLGAARDADVPYALSTSFAFGGNNAALLFGRAP